MNNLLKKILSRCIQIINTNRLIWSLYALLSIFSGVLVIGAMSSLVYVHRGGNTFTAIPIIKHISFLAIGGIIIVILPWILNSVNRITSSLVLYTFISFCTIIVLLFGGKNINGAVRWIDFLGITIQPSEFVKLALIFLCAFTANLVYKARQELKNTANYVERDRINKRIRHYFLILWGISGLVIVVILIGNLSTAIILSGCVGIMTIMMQPPLKFTMRAVGVTILLIVISFMILKISNSLPARMSTWESRVSKLFSSEKDPLSIDDNNLQEKIARISLANGGIKGVGFNNGKMKNSLPLAYADFILVMAYEEYGLRAPILIGLLFFLWMIFAKKIGDNTNNRILKFVAYGIAIFYPTQVLFNFAVAAGLFMTGQPLPIIGNGGSSIISSAIALGVLASINNINEKRKLNEDYKQSDN